MEEGTIKLSPHQERMIQEKQELDYKITKLLNFFSTETFAKLEKLDRQLMNAQHAMMESYSKILGQRISRF